MSGSLAGFRSSKSTNAEEIQVHDGCSCASALTLLGVACRDVREAEHGHLITHQ